MGHAVAYPRPPRILVVGLGNILMGDDGVGVHACRAWLAQSPAPRHYLVAEVGTAILSATHLLEWADCILTIDAMQADGPPGSLYLAHPDQLAVNSPSISLHDQSLVGALWMLRSRRPRRIAVLGIEPERIAIGTELSSPVARSMPTVLHEAKRIVSEWMPSPGRMPRRPSTTPSPP